MGARIWTHFYAECPDVDFSMTTARTNAATAITSSVDVRQGECAGVPIKRTDMAQAGSISIDAQLIVVQPFQTCNVTVHEVAECLDDPLVVAPVKDRVAHSECEERKFKAWTEVWVRLDCEEVGTGSWNKYHNSISRNKPVRRHLESI